MSSAPKGRPISDHLIDEADNAPKPGISLVDIIYYAVMLLISALALYISFDTLRTVFF